MSKKKVTVTKKSAFISVESYKNKIVTFLQNYNKKMMPLNELESKCRTKKYGTDNFKIAVNELRSEGTVTVRKNMKISLCSRIDLEKGTVTRLNRTFGFAETDSGKEYFIPGKYMLGAMPGDRVLISEIPSRSGEPEGKIEDILEFGSSEMTGIIEKESGELYLVPDIATRNHVIIVKEKSVPFREGDKVLAEIAYRGKRHAEHKVRITSVFGSSESAYSCALSVIRIHGAVTEFPPEVLKEAKKIEEGGIQEFNFNNREDFRSLPVFTIDSSESKDLDDAVSVQKTDKGYVLGVHIADVSHYVKGNSETDKEALRRGTSIYYADKVIPMLPKELSNGICSLNPDENRLTLSAVIDLSETGEIISYRFCKSVIKSRVKGVYSEINSILDGSAENEILEKYSEVINEIPVMNELSDLLLKKRNNL